MIPCPTAALGDRTRAAAGALSQVPGRSGSVIPPMTTCPEGPQSIRGILRQPLAVRQGDRGEIRPTRRGAVWRAV
jgi:hypothetical protein